MKRYILIATIMLGGATTPLYAETKDAEVILKKLEVSVFSVDRHKLTLTVTFDVKEARIFDEVIFDFYLLLHPRDTDMKAQFMHCRTVHRYLDQKSGHKSRVVLDRSAVEGIAPNKEQHAVVVTYKGKEVGVKNSEKERWWDDPALGSPVENILWREAEVPIVRVWESVR